jgi:type IV pilus modification protein PilV
MRRPSKSERGFTLIEVLVALSIMSLGMIGILALQKAATSASGYSRRATEAAVLAEDRLEEMRTLPLSTVTDDSDVVDASGVANDDGLFTRTWTLVLADELATITVRVQWNESDGTHAITFRTLRTVE